MIDFNQPDWFTFAMAVTAFLAELFYGMTSFGVAITTVVGYQISHLLKLSDGSIKGAVVRPMHTHVLANRTHVLTRSSHLARGAMSVACRSAWC